MPSTPVPKCRCRGCWACVLWALLLSGVRKAWLCCWNQAKQCLMLGVYMWIFQLWLRTEGEEKGCFVYLCLFQSVIKINYNKFSLHICTSHVQMCNHTTAVMWIIPLLTVWIVHAFSCLEEFCCLGFHTCFLRKGLSELTMCKCSLFVEPARFREVFLWHCWYFEQPLL